MPYYVYKIFPDKRLEPLGDSPSYRDAKAILRDMLAKEGQGNGVDQPRIRMIFAANPMDAERLLSTVREVEVFGDD